MKKQKNVTSSPKRPVRSLAPVVLIDARGGDGGSAPPTGNPYIGEQHNETLIRSVRARHGRKGRARRG